jgi:hypothetical protein
MSSCSSESYQHYHIPATPDEQELIPTVQLCWTAPRRPFEFLKNLRKRPQKGRQCSKERLYDN